MMHSRRHSLMAILIAATALTALGRDEPRVAPIPDAVRKTFKLSPFYQKYVDLHGFPIVRSSNVSDYALLEAAWTVNHLLTERADILHTLASNNVRLAVMAAANSRPTSPNTATSRTPPIGIVARAVSAPPDSRPSVRCREENLFAHPGDPYSTENILIHEFAHAIHEMALTTGPRAIDAKLRATFARPKKRTSGKALTPQATSASTGRAVQSWFDTNRENDKAHNHVNTRDELRA